MKETKYPAEALLKSKEFSGYQPDFAKAVLGGGEYTKAEARKALDGFFKKKGRE